MAVHIETTRPGKLILLLSLIIVILAIVSRFTPIAYVSPNHFWVLAAGYGVLLFGNLYGK